jgi:hypothetical protein
MSLRRYNEIMLAVVLTVALLAFLLYLSRVAWQASIQHRAGNRAPESVADVPGVRSSLGRSMALCLPAFAAGTDYQYFPVTAVRSAAEIASGAGASLTTNLSEACHLPEGVLGGIFDVVIRNSATNDQRLVLNHPGQVLDMALPDPSCASGAGSVPCGTVFWLLRDEDSDSDGVIDARDSSILYVSDLSAKQLFRLSPKDASVLDWVWNSRSGEVLMQIKRAGGATEVVNARLQPEAPGISVVQAQTLEQLQRVLQ